MKCKCHGVSGSCSIRTCWRGLQDLREIAMDLKTKYLSATKVVHRPMGTRKQLVPKDIDIRPVRENELVYLQSSPDFCTKNEKQGSVGTQDRWDYPCLTLSALTQRGFLEVMIDLCCLGILSTVTHSHSWKTGNGCVLIKVVDSDEVLPCVVAPFSLETADNSLWPLSGLCLWPVWACVTENTTVTGVLVLLSETMTNAVILGTKCTAADIDWRGPHKWGNS